MLLLEAGGSDDLPQIMRRINGLQILAASGIGTSGPTESLSQRPDRAFAMGKVLGGGSSINTMVWARGHKTDWDLFAQHDIGR